MNLYRRVNVGMLALVATLAFALADHARASVVIAGTRVVYNAKDSEVTLSISNKGQEPALIQSWIDNGDLGASPSSVDVPFTVTPPMSRVDPAKGQTLRIIYTGEPLPQDKESVFWLNVLEVPPKPSAGAAENKLQLAFRSRIKLFFRPTGLKGVAADAPAALTWRWVGSAGQPAIEVHNPTPYFVSLTEVELAAGGASAVFDDGVMVGPSESQRLSLRGSVAAPAGGRVRYSALNDYGGPVSGETALTQVSRP